VTGGTNGLWGTAAKRAGCPAGTQSPCGDGAVGIDNLWHDSDPAGNEEPAGSNPMWHAKNLENGITGDYLAAYGLTPSTDPDDRLSGTYSRNYSSALVAPWLWNSTKKVFLSTEDEQSLGAKADYIAAKGIGGLMIWELAGDYAFDSAKGEYLMGNTLTNLAYDKFKTASAYGASRANRAMPSTALNVNITLSGFALGDANYPINPHLTVVNNSTTTIPGGAALEFDYGTSAPGTMSQQSGWSMTVTPGHTGTNVGGLRGDFHHATVTIPSYLSIAPGASAEVVLNYVLPIASPSNYTLTFGGTTYALAVDNPRGTVPASPSAPASPSTGASGSPSVSPSRTAGPSASPSTPPPGCTDPVWSPTQIYTSQSVSWNGHKYTAKWWTQGNQPDLNTGDGKPWTDNGVCGTVTTSPSASPSRSASASPSPSASPSRSASVSPSASRSPSASPSPSGTTGTYPAWAPNVSYAAGTRVSYGGKNYQCLQPHTSLVGWEPPNVPALWQLI
jgi:chitodextrinase